MCSAEGHIWALLSAGQPTIDARPRSGLHTGGKRISACTPTWHSVRVFHQVQR